MADSVIAVVANDSYLPHAKALMVNCRRQGNWQGDFCFVTCQDCDPGDLAERGIDVLVTADETWTSQVKFHLFSDYFRRWKRLLYLDCDVLVQGDLNAAVEGLSEKLPAIACDGGQQPEDGSILKGWEYFADNYGKGPGRTAYLGLFDKLQARFPFMNELTFGSDVMFFAPETIPEGTVRQLQALSDEFIEIIRGCDQPVIVTHLYDRMVPITKDFCCWFAFDDPGNRVAARGWRGDEEPAILHYFSWFAPWLVKQPGAGAYFIHRLNRVCHELYAENLAAFEATFPVRQ